MRENPYKRLPPIERRQDGSLYRMTPAQRKQANALIRQNSSTPGRSGLLQVVPLVGLAANRDAGNRDFPGYGAKTLCCLRRGVRPKVQPGEILSRLCRRSSQAAENRK